MRDLHRWTSVLVCTNKNHFAIINQRVNVKYFASDKLSQQMMCGSFSESLATIKLCDCSPDVIGFGHLSNPDRRNIRARLDHPRWRDTFRELPDFFMTNQSYEFRNL